MGIETGPTDAEYLGRLLSALREYPEAFYEAADALLARLLVAEERARATAETSDPPAEES